MTDENLTLEKAKEKVREQECTIESLINPSDLIHQDIDSWENADIGKLKMEIAENMLDAWTYGINHPYGGMIADIAVRHYIDDMIRIPFDHLTFDSRVKCVIEGYWLYDMSRREVIGRVYNNKDDIDCFHYYEQDVAGEIENAILDARMANFEE